MKIPNTESMLKVAEARSVLTTIRQLCEDLRSFEINYCHWKSNAMLDRSASGENDLDLLIDRSHSQLFIEVVNRLGFKEFLAPVDIDVPGIRDFFGNDPGTNKIIHVHAHFQLIVGHDYSKNYHIPIEREYLDSSLQEDLFRVPDPRYELILFVLRMMIKHFSWDAFLTNQARLSKNEIIELSYLHNKTELSGFYEILNNHFPTITKDLFTDCLNVLQSNVPVHQRFIIGQKLHNKLQIYARQPHLVEDANKIFRPLKRKVQRRLLKRKFYKRNANGGLLVGIIGGDGSGKTTALEGVYKWLSPRFSTSCFHMGKPKWSWSTIILRGLLKIGSILGITKFSEASYTYMPEEGGVLDYSMAIRTLCLANDRYLTYKKARRLASNGNIVICDRFPMPNQLEMDGPKIQRMVENNPNNKILNWLRVKEQKLYQSIFPPDLLIILQLDPEIAIMRKSDENSDYVRARSANIIQIDWTKTHAIIIDASKSRDKVLSEIQALIWSMM